LAGGSLYGHKTTGSVNINNFYEVDCIDIREYIVNLRAEYVVVKLNCEGAEYEIIPHLQEVRVNKYYIQWHWDKVGISKAKHNMISSMVKWYPWEAQFRSERFKKEFIRSCDIW
jgi:hypothetical protein